MKRIGEWFLVWILILGVIVAFLVWHLNNFFYADDFILLAFVRLTQNPFEGAFQRYYGEFFWRPLDLLSVLACERFFGLNPFGWHLLDLFLHSLNSFFVAVLVYLLLPNESELWRKITSALAGIFYALHPISLLSSAWVSCRPDLLWFFFATSSLSLLLQALNSKRLVGLKIVFATLLSFLAYLCKETAMILPGIVALVVLFQPAPKPPRKKILEAILFLLLFSLILGIYLALRYRAVGFIGGYEPIQLSPSFILPRLRYHLPKILARAVQDHLFWHLNPQNQGSAWFWLLFFPYLALGILALIHFLSKPRALLLGLFWILLALVPLWNLSQMLFYAEARLFYFGLAGLAIIFGFTLSELRHRLSRILGLFIFLLLLLSLGRISFSELKFFQKRCQEFQAVKTEVFKAIGTEQRSSGANFPRRIYLIGLDFDFYALDHMFKTYNPYWLNQIIVPGDKPSSGWLNKETALSYQQKSQFLPEVESKFSDGKVEMVTITPPPDLPLAITHDSHAMVLEWKEEKLENITKEVLQLFQERRFLQEAHKSNLKLFPNYEFRKRNYPLDWKLSPGLELKTPTYLGELYTFVSKNNDPYLISPPLNFLALATSELKFQMRIQEKNYLAPQEQEGCLFWTTSNDPGEFAWTKKQQICFPIYADGKWHTYQIRLDHNLYWLRSFKITRIRLDPIAFPGWFQLDSLSFSPIPSQE